MGKDKLAELGVDFGREPDSLLEHKARRDAILNEGLEGDQSQTDNEPELLQDNPEPDEIMRIKVAHTQVEHLPEAEETIVESPRPRPTAQRRKIKPPERISDYLETSVQDSIRIEMTGLKMTIGILEFCVTDRGLAFFVPLDTTFEPDMKTEIKVIYRDRAYTVVYAGGFFTFKALGFSLVSFIRTD